MPDQQKLNSIWYKDEAVPLKYKLLSKIFSFFSGFRRNLYSIGFLKRNKIKCPVIIVGNITVGGVGKTPFVIWLVNQLQSKGYKVGVVSRGYGGKREQEPMLIIPQTSARASGDEPLLISKHTHAKIMVGKNRAKAAKSLFQEYRPDVIIADDGLQHYALGRDMEICLIDAEKGLGNQQLLPAGPLREKKERLDSVDLVVYKGKKAEQLSFHYEPLMVYKLGKTKQQKSIKDFRNQPIHAVAGIAHPDGFFKMLSDQGLAVIKHPLDDHHEIQASDLQFNDDSVVFITEKDAVKCGDIKTENVWVVVLKLVISEEHKNTILEKVEKVLK